jgi:hypothetical protein
VKKSAGEIRGLQQKLVPFQQKKFAEKRNVCPLHTLQGAFFCEKKKAY